MDKVVVIGAYGFIGFHLTKELLENGLTVYSVDLPYRLQNNDSKEEKLLEIGRNANLINVEGYENLEEVDVIYVCFEQEGIHDEDYVKSCYEYLDETIKWCQTSSTKLVFTSTLSVVNHNVNRITEETECAPMNDIGKFYLILERKILEQDKTNPFSYMILRFPTLYGPWQPIEYAYHQALVLKSEDKPLKRIKDIYTEDILFISDAVQALIQSINVVTSEIIHITSGRSKDWEHGLNLILGEKCSTTPSTVSKLSTEKAVKTLSFKPTVKIEEGIKLQRDHLLQKRFE